MKKEKQLLTLITCVSLQVSKLHKGGMTPQLMSAATCALLPLMLKFDTAHAASFCVWNSPLVRFSTIFGSRPASITACTCCLLPAVTFDKNHTASLQIFSFCKICESTITYTANERVLLQPRLLLQGQIECDAKRKRSWNN